MSQIIQSTNTPDVPKSIFVFFQIGWAIIGLTIIVTLYGLSMLMFYEAGNSEGITGFFSKYFAFGENGAYVPIFSYPIFILEMLTFGIIPGFLMIGIGYHLKKLWQSSHYPW